ncbi:hypothetical protein ColLi_02186 [Colletotrichum liriopes]|uniref:Uncharacterized protein n=1 Tax=Colletotrichum liriopes TaxID=708192 RepID=A0AA37LPC6_9PEZI|nr:hypothetical protein ColLi_02186 [Colletotrichum liriopes]
MINLAGLRVVPVRAQEGDGAVFASLSVSRRPMLASEEPSMSGVQGSGACCRSPKALAAGFCGADETARRVADNAEAALRNVTIRAV